MASISSISEEEEYRLNDIVEKYSNYVPMVKKIKFTKELNESDIFISTKKINLDPIYNISKIKNIKLPEQINIKIAKYLYTFSKKLKKTNKYRIILVGYGSCFVDFVYELLEYNNIFIYNETYKLEPSHAPTLSAITEATIWFDDASKKINNSKFYAKQFSTNSSKANYINGQMDFNLNYKLRSNTKVAIFKNKYAIHTGPYCFHQNQLYTKKTLLSQRKYIKNENDKNDYYKENDNTALSFLEYFKNNKQFTVIAALNNDCRL